QRDVADWLSFWYTADFTLFQPSWFRSTQFRDPAEFLARSPVRYADSVTTPLMFILGDADLRTPPTQGGEAMFRALKYLHRTTVQVRFPGESHELSRSGKPGSPGGAPAAHPELVRQVPAGETDYRVRHAMTASRHRRPRVSRRPITAGRRPTVRVRRGRTESAAASARCCRTARGSPAGRCRTGSRSACRTPARRGSPLQG